MKNLIILGLVLAISSMAVLAEVETYGPMPLRYEIELNFVVTETEEGERAQDFGDQSQRDYIQSQMDKILAQFGARVKFPASDSIWVSDYAYEGSASDTGSRTTGDLNWIFNNIPASYYQPDTGVVTVVFCERTPGFDYRGFYSANGYAYIGANGITFFLGEGMLRNNSNMDIVAALLAHELGHNLNLRHINSQFNLMNPTIYEGYLESDQIETVVDGRFTHGFFAQFGAPELVIDERSTGIYLKYLRSADGIEQLVTSTDLRGGSWLPQSSSLDEGVFYSNFYSFSANPQRFFRLENAGAGSDAGARNILRSEHLRTLPSPDCESIGCGMSGLLGSAHSK